MKTLLFSLLFSSFSFAGTLTSLDRLEAFNCVITGFSGVTEVKYEKNKKYEVQTRRNYWNAAPYSLNGAGHTYTQKPQTFINLSGGGILPNNHYLTLLFPGKLESGNNKVSGTVLYVVAGGSIFAPTTDNMRTVGSVRCSSVEVK